MRINSDAHIQLKKKIILNKVKNVALMGDRVIRKFALVHPVLQEAWKKMQENSIPYGKNKVHPAYGFMGEVELEGHKTNIFGMPFPTTIPIKDKYKFYEEMVRAIRK